MISIQNQIFTNSWNQIVEQVNKVHNQILFRGRSALLYQSVNQLLRQAKVETKKAVRWHQP